MGECTPSVGSRGCLDVELDVMSGRYAMTKRMWADRGRRWFVAGLSWLLLARSAAAVEPLASDAETCSEEAGATDPEAAREAFRVGQTAFSEGAYVRAVQLWGQAYRDDCTAHALLLNLAMAQELLGRPEEAIQALKRFDRRAPDSPYVDANLKRIQRLERLVGERARERARRERAPLTPLEPHRTEPADQGGKSLGLPLVVAVTGGVVTVVGAALYAEGRYSAAAASERCGSSPGNCEDPTDVVDGERARARAETAGWLAGGGLATAAGGLLWHFLSQPTRPIDQSTNARPLVNVAPSGGTLVSWTGTF